MLSLFADEEDKAWRETDDADHLENIKPDGLILKSALLTLCCREKAQACYTVLVFLKNKINSRIYYEL